MSLAPWMSCTDWYIRERAKEGRQGGMRWVNRVENIVSMRTKESLPSMTQ